MSELGAHWFLLSVQPWPVGLVAADRVGFRGAALIHDVDETAASGRGKC